MKLKKKLATVLMAATVVSAVPTITSAQSTNHMTKQPIVAEYTSFTASNAPVLVIEAGDAVVGEEFLVELDNASWSDWDASATSEIVLGNTKNAKVVIVSQTVAKVTVTNEASTISIPMLTDIEEGEATVTIDGGYSTITGGCYTFATTLSSSYAANIEVTGTLPTVYEEGTIGNLLLSETLTGSLASGGEVVLTLNNSDYEFTVPASGKIQLATGKGFAGQTVTANIEYGKNDSQIIITIPSVTASIKGTLTITGLEVACTSAAPKTGDLTLDITGSSVERIRNVKVANIASYSGSLTSTAVDALSGQTAEIEFRLKEDVADSFTSGRKIEVALNQGFFIPVETTASGKYDASATTDALVKAMTVTQYKSLTSSSNQTIALSSLQGLTPILDEDAAYVIGFSFTAGDYTNLNFAAEINLPISASGDVEVEVTGRALNSEVLTTKVANVTEAISIKTETAQLKVGVSKQTVGKITITEADAQAIEEGYLEINLGSEFKFVTVPTVEVTKGDLKVGTVKYTTNSQGETILKVAVDRDSQEASTIVISDFVVTVNNTLATGQYDITIGGAALTEIADDTLEVEGFFAVSSADEETTTSTISKFVLGSTTYTVNGVDKTMDVAVQDANGRIYVPIRFVADALGINGNNIVWSSSTKTATIMDGNRILQLGLNTKTALLNGVSFDMSSEVMVQDGRILVPVGEIGRLLGVTVDWDNTTKTATFQR